MLRGSELHRKNESVAPGDMSLDRQAEPDVFEKTSLPGRSSRRIVYVPEAGAVIRTAMAVPPCPLPPLVRVPSLGTGLKKTSPVEASTPTVLSSVANCARGTLSSSGGGQVAYLT